MAMEDQIMTGPIIAFLLELLEEYSNFDVQVSSSSGFNCISMILADLQAELMRPDFTSLLRDFIAINHTYYQWIG